MHRRLGRRQLRRHGGTTESLGDVEDARGAGDTTVGQLVDGASQLHRSLDAELEDDVDLAHPVGDLLRRDVIHCRRDLGDSLGVFRQVAGRDAHLGPGGRDGEQVIVGDSFHRDGQLLQLRSQGFHPARVEVGRLLEGHQLLFELDGGLG